MEYNIGDEPISTLLSPSATGLGNTTTNTRRCDRLVRTVAQAAQEAPSKACGTASALIGTRSRRPLVGTSPSTHVEVPHVHLHRH